MPRSIISHEMSLFDTSTKYADVTPLDAVIQKLDEYTAPTVPADD